jgi:hypothetical protein
MILTGPQNVATLRDGPRLRLARSDLASLLI